MDSSFNFVALQRTWPFFSGLSEVLSNGGNCCQVHGLSAKERSGGFHKARKLNQSKEPSLPSQVPT